MQRCSPGSLRSVQLPLDHLVEKRERAVCHQLFTLEDDLKQLMLSFSLFIFHYYYKKMYQILLHRNAVFYFISNRIQYEALDSGIQNKKSFRNNLEQIFKVRKALS